MSTIYNIELCRRRLRELGCEQKDLAEPGLSESVISKLFRGDSVRNSTAARIVAKLGLEMRDVLLDERELAGAGSRRRR